MGLQEVRREGRGLRILDRAKWTRNMPRGVEAVMMKIETEQENHIGRARARPKASWLEVILLAWRRVRGTTGGACPSENGTLRVDGVAARGKLATADAAMTKRECRTANGPVFAMVPTMSLCMIEGTQGEEETEARMMNAITDDAK